MKEARPHSLAVVDALIAAGASLSAVNAAGTSPLHWSVHSDSDALITGLIHRLCPQLADSQHAPPAPSGQPLPLCEALLATNERNETALHWAVDWQKTVAVSTLLRLADGSRGSGSASTTASQQLTRAADVHGDTALHRLPVDCPSSAACRLIAQLVIARGANVTAENDAHRTPLAHFPTPAAAEGSGDDGLEQQVERFRRNVSQHFSTLP